MKLIVGLGNPGQKYMNNRHNAGHLFIDFLNSKLRITDYELKNKTYRLTKTDCYMNVSGIFVKKLIRNSSFEIRNLYVVHDDLDIPLGSFKIQFGRGPKVHNGIDSVEEELATDEFWRIRIGIDGRPFGERAKRVSGEEYVLSDFTNDELKTLADMFSQVAIRLKSV